MTTFSTVLERQLRHEPGRPLVTFYDESTGERVELSVATYANWVAKSASLLVEEHDLERGMSIRIDLPTHWLTTVFLGAAWQVGLVVSDGGPAGPERPDAVVCGPDSVAEWAPYAAELPVLACSLLPLGVRFTDPLPSGVHDVGIEVWSQPDSFIPWDPARPEDPALALTAAAESLHRTQGDLWSAAAAGESPRPGGDRLLSEANPASPPGLASFTEPLRDGGSVVLVVHADPDRLEAIAAAERATVRGPR
ncbi:TIGR03089 family protein [Nocardioides insulae]|uniref:TIGR03089 family protein n=1 Tax=Nocardioides insulae TaxID=394734 RepID=UPI0003FA5AE2|nr:TIGR03089 family protein [Nocardioides insulae]